MARIVVQPEDFSLGDETARLLAGTPPAQTAASQQQQDTDVTEVFVVSVLERDQNG